MQLAYKPYVMRRLAEGRVFFVNQEMPFECVLDCFQAEQPFFVVSQLNDGRIAVTPNTFVIPHNYLQAGHRPEALLPAEVEYVTMRECTYPIIISAHPVNNVDEWLRRFERLVVGFARQSLGDFITSSWDFIPLRQAERTSQRTTTQQRETVTA